MLPEIYYGAYEYDVHGKYIYYEKKDPIYVFILDVSAEAHNNGLFTQTLDSIAYTLDSIPNPDKTEM